MDKLSRIELSAEAAVTALLLYYLGNVKIIAALAAAVIAHETGHASAIILCGGEITGLKADMKGLCIEYNSTSEYRENIMIAIAGPLAGAAYAAIALVIGGEITEMSAGLSLILSFYNMLPAIPLDGGMIMQWLLMEHAGEDKGRETARKISFVTAECCMIIGMVLLLKGEGAAALTAAIWIFLCQKESEGL